MSHNFRELQIWQEGIKNASFSYTITKNFPKEELFGLISQMRRCAVSIPSNISEGCGRGTNPQLVHFLDIAIGSSFELETQIIIATDLNYIEKNVADTWLINLHTLQNRIFAFKNKISAS